MSLPNLAYLAWISLLVGFQVLHAEHLQGRLGVQGPERQAQQHGEHHDGPAPVGDDAVQGLEDPEHALGHEPEEAEVHHLRVGLPEGRELVRLLGTQVEPGLRRAGGGVAPPGIAGDGGAELPDRAEVVAALDRLHGIDPCVQAQHGRRGGELLALADPGIAEHLRPGHRVDPALVEGEDAIEAMHLLLVRGHADEGHGRVARRRPLDLEDVPLAGQPVDQLVAGRAGEGHGLAVARRVPRELGLEGSAEAAEGQGDDLAVLVLRLLGEESGAVLAPDRLDQGAVGRSPGQLEVSEDLGEGRSRGAGRHGGRGGRRCGRLRLHGGGHVARRRRGHAGSQKVVAPEQDHAQHEEEQRVLVFHLESQRLKASRSWPSISR